METESVKAKPFLKWAGGKGQLLTEIQKYYPFADKKITKYAEPFIGGGAVLFDVLNRYDLSEVYISDINAELVNCYWAAQQCVEELIQALTKMQDEYLPLNHEENITPRKEYVLMNLKTEKRKKVTLKKLR
jgi:DNA adenine methylase